MMAGTGGSELDPDLERRLRDAVLRSVGDGILRDIRFQPYVDHNDEEAIRVDVVLDADHFDDVDRIGVIAALHDALRARHLNLFPYAYFAREGEAA
jgi:hypothetical protein